MNQQGRMSRSTSSEDASFLPLQGEDGNVRDATGMEKNAGRPTLWWLQDDSWRSMVAFEPGRCVGARRFTENTLNHDHGAIDNDAEPSHREKGDWQDTLNVSPRNGLEATMESSRQRLAAHASQNTGAAEMSTPVAGLWNTV